MKSVALRPDKSLFLLQLTFEKLVLYLLLTLLMTKNNLGLLKQLIN